MSFGVIDAIMADADRGWRDAQRACEDYDGSAADEARDWWYGLTSEERDEIRSEYFEQIYDFRTYQADVAGVPTTGTVSSGLIKSLFDYRDVFYARPADLFGKAITGEDLRCKLSRRQVELIRLTYPTEGVSLRQLARGFGVSPSTMWKVLHGHSWKD